MKNNNSELEKQKQFNIKNNIEKFIFEKVLINNKYLYKYH